MTYLALTIVHHLLAFTLIAIIVGQLTMTMAPLSSEPLRRFQTLDFANCGLAVLILAVGALRVVHAPKGAEFYLQNPLFWTKIGLFFAAGLLALPRLWLDRSARPKVVMTKCSARYRLMRRLVCNPLSGAFEVRIC